MTTYTVIPTTDTDVDSPLTQSLMERLANNPLAIAEGDATAPRISMRALDTVAVSATDPAGGGVSTVNVTWTTESLDTKGYFNNATGVFTPLIAGKYEFIFSGRISTTSTGSAAVGFRKNASTNVVNIQPVVDGEFLTISHTEDMNGTTDFMSAFTFAAASASTSITDGTLTIKLIGR